MADNNKILQASQPDPLSDDIATTSKKLDADQYAADDIDGVTESLFGSGNMAYASMQASLSGSNINIQKGGTEPKSADISLDSGPNNNARDSNYIDDDINAGNSPSKTTGSIFSDSNLTDIDRGLVNTETPISNTGTSDGNFASSTVGSVTASKLSSDIGSFGPDGSDLSLFDGADGFNGQNGADGQSPDVPDYPMPDNGKDGKCVGIGDTIINVDLGDLTIELGDTIELLDTTIIELGETIEVLTTSLTDITTILGDVIINVTDNLLDLDSITNLITNKIENLEGDLTQIINTTLTEVTTITENVGIIVDKIKGLTLSVDADVLETIVVGADIPLGDILDSNLDLDIDLNPAYEFTTNIADLTGLDTLSDTLAELGGAIEVTQNTIDQVTNIVSDIDLEDPGETITQITETLKNLDQTVGDITEAVDDSVGGILGTLGIGNDFDNQGGTDTDVTVDTGIDLVDSTVAEAELEAIIDPIEDLAGDVDLDLGLETDLLNSADTDNDAGDTDITLGLDSDLVDNDLLDAVAEVELDPIENIVGDIDLDLGAGLDVLDDTADPIVNDGEGGTGDDTLLADLGDGLGDLSGDVFQGLETLETDLDIKDSIDLLNTNYVEGSSDSMAGDADMDTNWTESTIADAGGLFDDLANNTDGLGSDALPDPSGTVAEGIGALDVDPDLDVGSIGGLFG